MPCCCIYALDVLYGYELLVFTDEYGFGGVECGCGGVGFLWWTILENRGGVAKRRVHGIGGGENVVVVLFIMEGCVLHVTRNRCSDKEIIILGFFAAILFGFMGYSPWGIFNWFLVV